MSSGSTEETPIYIPEDAQAMHCTARHGPLSLPPPAHCSSPTSNKWASYISVHTMHGPLKRPNIAMALYHIPIQNLYLPNYPSPTQKAQTTLCGLPARNVGLSKRDDESAGDRKFLNLRSLRSVRPPDPSPSPCFRLALSISLALHRIPLLSLSDPGSSARRSSPASGGLPLSSPHRGAPRLLPARARMERRPRRALLGGAESSSGQRARGGGGRRDPPWLPPLPPSSRAPPSLLF